MQLVEPRPSRPLPIRLTPLIDVVFILLVFFMLTTRLLPVEHLVIDNATAGERSQSGAPLPQITLRSDGALTWRNERLSASVLAQKLVRGGVSKVVFMAEGSASLTAFTTSLGTLESAGIDVQWKRSDGAQ